MVRPAGKLALPFRPTYCYRKCVDGQGLSVTKKMGRPPKEPTVVVRLPASVVSEIDRRATLSGATRAEVIRKLIELG